jgi:hypothetical protein
MTEGEDAMENPIQFKSDKGLRCFGALLRGWAKGTTALPDGATKDGRATRIPAVRFVEFLTSEPQGLTEGVDFTIRPGIDRIELIAREASAASILLPEKAVIEAQEQATDTTVAMPRFYGDLWIPPSGGAEALYRIPLPADGMSFEDFMDRHLGFYTCAQCA